MGHQSLGVEGIEEAGWLVGAAEAVDDGPVRRRRLWTALRRDPAFWIGASLVAAFLAIALLAPWLAPWDPLQDDRSLAKYPSGPSPEHPLGTDRLGRDYLSRLIFGARAALVVGVGAAVVATAVGFAVGVIAAYARTVRVGMPLPGEREAGLPLPVESLLMRLTDVFLSLPALLLALALVAVLGPSLALAGFVITALLWAGTARIVYGAACVVREAEYVQAARALGASSRRLLLRHVAPQLAPLAIAYGAVTIAFAILFESSLSYLAAGVPAPTPSWGGMTADHVGSYVADPRLVVLPGGAILLTVVAFTLLGDALRDALDPRTRR